MAYMDPGNYGTAIQAGASFGYDLIWSVWLANMMAMLFQYLSGKLGIATEKSLPELIRQSLRTRFRILLYWLAAESAIAATDLAEYLGTVIALNLLFNVPLLYAAIFGAADVLILLTLTTRRFRTLEYFFMLFVSIIGMGFLYEIAVIGPDVPQILNHSLPSRLTSNNILHVVGIIGATVMPHALFVHSHLARNRLTKASLEEKRSLRRLHIIENVSLLFVAGLVNAAILVTSAVSFYPNYSNVSSVDEAYRIMIPLYGPLAATIFAITLLCSGLASSTTGTLAGQEVMDGLLGSKVNRYFRRLVTRIINVFPTTAAILIGLDPLSMLVYSQVTLSILIPLPMIPLIIYTNRKDLMGEFVNRKSTSLISYVSAVVIILLNGYLLYTLFARV